MAQLLLPISVSLNITVAINFTALGLLWKFEALYVLYNNETIRKNYLYENIEGILNNKPAYFAKRPFIVADIEASQRGLHEMMGFSANPLTVIVAAHTHDPVLSKANEVLKGKKCSCVIIVLNENYKQSKMESLFKYLFQQQFRHVLVLLTKRGHLYTMKPYPLMEVVNVTGKSLNAYFYPRLNWDFMGYRIQVPVQIDVPNMFWYYDNRSKRLRMDGIGGSLFETFMQAINVTMDVYPLYVNNSNYLNIIHIQELLNNNSIEISPHFYTTLDRKSIDYSYAYITSSRCIMLPIEDMRQFEVSHILPYHWTIWSMILLFIVMSDILCQLIMRYHPAYQNIKLYQRYYLPGTVAFNMICVLINIPMPDIKIFNVRNVPLLRYIRTTFCYIVITFSGFCFAQMYSPSLTSRLTVSIQYKPKTTADKILAMTQPIMATEQARKIFLMDKRFGRNAIRKMIFTTPENFHRKRQSMNTSYVYPTSIERWEILSKQQLFLANKLFWLSNICIGNFPLQYQMRLDSPFKPFLRRFIMHVCETGLYDHWKSHIFSRAKQFGYMEYFKNDKSLEHNAENKSFVFSLKYITISIYFSGVLLILMAFVMELVFGKFSKNNRGNKVYRRAGKKRVKFSGFELK